MSDTSDWRIEKLRTLVELQGWMPAGYYLQEGSEWPLPSSEPTDIRLISVEDVVLRGMIESGLAKDIRFAVKYGGDQEIVYGIRFSRVRDTDLSTLPQVREFLAERLGIDNPDKWNDAYEVLSKKANHDFETRLGELTIGGRSASEDLRAWNYRYGEAALEAQAFSDAPFRINGQHFRQVWDMAIHQFQLDDHERQILGQIPSAGLRHLISNMFYQIAREAYVLGRWIRESEIVQDHGEVIEKGRKYKNEKRAGGLKSGGGAAEIADVAWRAAGKEIYNRLRIDRPSWGATKIAKQIQKEVSGAAKLDLASVKATVEKWQRANNQ